MHSLSVPTSHIFHGIKGLFSTARKRKKKNLSLVLHPCKAGCDQFFSSYLLQTWQSANIYLPQTFPISLLYNIWPCLVCLKMFPVCWLMWWYFHVYLNSICRVERLLTLIEWWARWAQFLWVRSISCHSRYQSSFITAWQLLSGFTYTQNKKMQNDFLKLAKNPVQTVLGLSCKVCVTLL